MKFQDFLLLEEMFDADNGYKAEQTTSDNDVVFDIETGEARNYRFTFTKHDDNLYVAQLGYAGTGKDDIVQITSDFYDVNKVVSTLVGIFTGFYLSVTSAKTVVYKFQSNVDKGYKLLVHSIFKKELSNYYSLVELDDDVKDYGDKKYIVIHNNRNSGEDPDKDTIEKALRD